MSAVPMEVGLRKRMGVVREKKVTLSHGGGGKAMRDLIDDLFVRHFANAGREPQAAPAASPNTANTTASTVFQAMPSASARNTAAT